MYIYKKKKKNPKTSIIISSLHVTKKYSSSSIRMPEDVINIFKFPLLCLSALLYK